MMFYYDRRGNAISHGEANKLFEDSDARCIALDEVGEVKLSTVHLVLNHSFIDSELLIFETLIMGGPRDGAMWRYETEDEARAGHAAVLAELTTAQGVTLEEIELELPGL